MSQKKHAAQAAKNSRKIAKTAPRRGMPLWGIVTIVLLVVAALGASALVWLNNSANPAASAPAQAEKLPANISVAQAYDLYQQGTFVLDVRTQEEWDEYHAPNTTLIPLDQLESRLNELPKDKPIVVICRSGNRSQEGRNILLNAGFNATSVDGGLSTWREAGYPTE
jgi:rhodanese-related sulfurtransferase